jgi:serine/threonine protein kinase
MSPLSSDNRIGHFRIVGRLGEGGMGVVYRARDEQLARDVAVKVLPAERLGDPTARARLLREARSAAALNHPHICGVYEVGEEQGEAYIAMELVEGRPLSGILAAGALAPAEVARYGMQLADALAHAHSRGIVHRDLKSANVVINDDDRAKVLDFGLAKPFAGVDGEEATRTGVSLTEVGVVSGTLAYMAPEQFRGLPADARTDIWALGIVLHEMASGERPFQGETGFALSSAILNAPPAPLPASVPVELRAVVARCLEKDPARRYQSAGDVSAALQAIQAGTTSAWVTWQYRLTRSAYAPAALLALAVLLVAGSLGREWLRVGFGGAPRPPSVAVLPLENLSSDPEQDYLADAVHEGIISDLSDIKGLRVIQRASLRRYRDTRKSPSEVARELGGVDSIVTGAILPAGNRVRLTVHLMRASDEQPLWDGKYDHELTDVLTLQNQVTNAIAGELKIRLAPEHADRLAKPARKVNPATYDLVARARFHAHKNTPEGFEKAVAYLTQAVQDDPGEPLAWSSLAMIYSLMAHEGVPGMQEKAGPPARRAIELDPTLAEAHQALGETKAYADRNLQGA